MAYVIGLPCVDVNDLACVEECPVDCIYEGGRMLYIHPDECVDCGACEPVCPVEAIYYEDDLPDPLRIYTAENAQFFSETLPGRTLPLGSPGGAGRLGPLSSDTPTVAALPPQTS
jgi:NAD-dependent dihydropyrimidine dehydrogenase PreA subunit